MPSLWRRRAPVLLQLLAASLVLAVLLGASGALALRICVKCETMEEANLVEDGAVTAGWASTDKPAATDDDDDKEKEEPQNIISGLESRTRFGVERVPELGEHTGAMTLDTDDDDVVHAWLVGDVVGGTAAMPLQTGGNAGGMVYSGGDGEPSSPLLEFAAEYECLKEGDAAMVLSVPFEDDVSGQDTLLEIRFVKQCRGGFRSGFLVGTTQSSSDVVSDGQVQPDWEPVADGGSTDLLQVVGADVRLQDFFVWLSEESGSQRYDFRVHVERPDVARVVLGGDAHYSQTIADDDIYPQQLSVVTDCLRVDGQTVVTLTLHMELFQPISFSWLKICKDSDPLQAIRKGLDIGSTPGASDVVRNGVLSAAWNVSMSAKSRHSPAAGGRGGGGGARGGGEHHHHKHDNDNDDDDELDDTSLGPVGTHTAHEDELSSQFFLRLTEPGDYQHLAPPVVSSYPPGIMRPYLTSGNAGGMVHDVPYTMLNLWYSCSRRGSAVVKLSLVMDGHHSLELSWIKSCVRQSDVVDASVWTANQMMLMMLGAVLLFGGGLVYAAVFRKRRVSVVNVHATGGRWRG